MAGIRREGNQAVVTMLQPYFKHARIKEGVQVDMPDYLENALELLDKPGEWYLDRPAKTVYYLPRPGEDLGKAEVIAPALEKLVELRGTLDRPVHNIHFVGIAFEHGNWLRPSMIGHCDVQSNFIVDSRPQRFVHPSRRLRQPAQRNPQESGQRGLPRGQVDPLRALHVHPAGRGRIGYRGRLAGQRRAGLPVP